ncbi:DUF4012 domain-containing protein [Marmoricola sp. OAE513]|uniref:DUF4012 domain-containing protein n=1 Tax=Marmoricola sp. OAE513 TaxID=2817894 RepID=UPI00339A2CD4
MARRYVLAAVGTLGAVVLVLAIWMIVDVLRVRAALNDARTQANDLTEQFKVVGPGGENQIAAQLGRDITKARKITEGPMWSLGEKLPLLGGDFQVVAEAASAIEDVANVGVPGLTKLSTERDNGALSVKDGRVDLSVIRRLTPILQDSDRVFTEGRRKFRAIDLTVAHGPVRSALAKVQDKLFEAQEAVSKGADALERAPEMLGADGPRSYLLVFQNNAELRSTGGIPGAFVELTANNGALIIKRQGEGSSTGFFDPPAVAVTNDEQALYGKLIANYWVDANFTPDFPRTAQILRAMYRSKYKKDLDGVVSLDPVALARILRATGPVQVRPNVALSSENVIGVLLNAVYTEYPEDDDAQNLFFAQAAKKIFEAFTTGSADSGELIKELQASLQEGRVIVNATKPEEQALFAGSKLAGELPVDTGATPNVGLYLNDSSASKLDFYMRRQTTVKATRCDADKVQTFRVTTTMKSEAPRRVTDLGPGVVGFSSGSKKGHMSTVLTWYAPLGGRVTALNIDGRQVSVNRAKHKGLFVATASIDLAPGKRTSIVATIKSGPGQQKDGVFRTTPGVEVTPNYVKIDSAC